MTNEKRYSDNCPICSTPMLRRKRDIGKDCKKCLMSKIGTAYAEKRRANPTKQTQQQYTKNSFNKDPFKFRMSRTCSQAKIRAKKANVPFSITRQDLIDMFPADNLCPILKVPFVWGTKHNKDLSPSLDRMIPELGYTKENVRFISYKANRIKNDSTIEILKNLIKYMES
jgi:ribosomal protein L37AE/L43A